MKGIISDAKCAAKHSDGSAKSQNCIIACVKGGSAPVLVSDGKVYKFENSSKVMDYIGKQVVVSGKVDRDTVTVDSVRVDH